MAILSLFTHSHVVPNLYDFLSSNFWIIFRKMSIQSSMWSNVVWTPMLFKQQHQGEEIMTELTFLSELTL